MARMWPERRVGTAGGGVRDNLAFISIFLWGNTVAFYYAFVILRIKGIRRKCSANQFHLNFVKSFYWYCGKIDLALHIVLWISQTRT